MAWIISLSLVKNAVYLHLLRLYTTRSKEAQTESRIDPETEKQNQSGTYLLSVPKDIKSLIMEYYYGMEHVERMRKCHLEMFIYCIIPRPVWCLSLTYTLFTGPRRVPRITSGHFENRQDQTSVQIHENPNSA